MMKTKNKKKTKKDNSSEEAEEEEKKTKKQKQEPKKKKKKQDDEEEEESEDEDYKQMKDLLLTEVKIPANHVDEVAQVLVSNCFYTKDALLKITDKLMKQLKIGLGHQVLITSWIQLNNSVAQGNLSSNYQLNDQQVERIKESLVFFVGENVDYKKIGLVGCGFFVTTNHIITCAHNLDDVENLELDDEIHFWFLGNNETLKHDDAQILDNYKHSSTLKYLDYDPNTDCNDVAILETTENFIHQFLPPKYDWNYKENQWITRALIRTNFYNNCTVFGITSFQIDAVYSTENTFEVQGTSYKGFSAACAAMNSNDVVVIGMHVGATRKAKTVEEVQNQLALQQTSLQQTSSSSSTMPPSQTSELQATTTNMELEEKISLHSSILENWSHSSYGSYETFVMSKVWKDALEALQ
eukprot:c20931_g1_i1.p1 GENE.c20931_g1_i1~~c20931_g1_i1.p1  ORF type:complete len:411 (+),score=56.43 c20931_g1_i1:157-1389(+)